MGIRSFRDGRWGSLVGTIEVLLLSNPIDTYEGCAYEWMFIDVERLFHIGERPSKEHLCSHISHLKVHQFTGHNKT
jgi:hypothetical protein